MLALSIYAAVVGTLSLGLVAWKYLSVFFKKVTVSSAVGGVWGFKDPQVSVQCENKTKKNFTVTNIGMTIKGTLQFVGMGQEKKSDEVQYLSEVMDIYPTFPSDEGPEKISLPATIHPSSTMYACMSVEKLLTNYLANYEIAHVTIFVEDDSKNRHKCPTIEVDVRLWRSLLPYK